MKRSLVVVLALLAACSGEISDKKQTAESSPKPQAPPPPPKVSYYEGTHAADAIAQIRAKVGEPFRVVNIDIDDDTVRLKAQDPKNKENVDEYEIENGKLEPPKPVRLIATDQKTLEANLFDPTDVDLSKVPDLLREANEKVQLEGRKLSDVTIARDMFEGGRPVMMDVNYRGTRKTGYLRADRHGAHAKVSIF